MEAEDDGMTERMKYFEQILALRNSSQNEETDSQPSSQSSKLRVQENETRVGRKRKGGRSSRKRRSSASSTVQLPSAPSSEKLKGQQSQPDRETRTRRRKSTGTVSQYFSDPKSSPGSKSLSRPRQSGLTFPPIKASQFGLVQEKLRHRPFDLLLATIFLNKTKGSASMPVFRQMIADYPTPLALAEAPLPALVSLIRPLGLQNQRAAKIKRLARTWVDEPPRAGARYRKLHYPARGDGRDVAPADEPIADEERDARVAWEVAHLPGCGDYALDSWRIFCRDELRGTAGSGLMVEMGEGEEELSEAAVQIELAQEWTRVLPLDKELRPYLQWRWLRIGYMWNFETGERAPIDLETRTRLERREITEFNGIPNPWMLETKDFKAGKSTKAFWNSSGGVALLKARRIGADELETPPPQAMEYSVPSLLAMPIETASEVASDEPVEEALGTSSDKNNVHVYKRRNRASRISTRGSQLNAQRGRRDAADLTNFSK